MDGVEPLRLAFGSHHEEFLLAVHLKVSPGCKDDELVVVGEVSFDEHARNVVKRILTTDVNVVGRGIADAKA